MSSVYFLQCEAAGAIKIGIARDVRTRMSALQIASPFPLALLGTVPGGRAAEQRLHYAARHHRRRGEWFDASPEVINIMEKALMGDIPDMPPKAADKVKDGRKQPIDRTAPASIVAEKFGGLVKFCEALERVTPTRRFAPSTVHRWLVKGIIPADHNARTLAAAKLAKVKVTADDLIDKREPVEA